ncbi:MAG: hypothetical protein AB1452_16885, partial [Pseudomonadota bacterium]
MNRSQKIVLGGALVNLLLLMLFPPYDVESLMRGTPVFDAFHPVFAAPPNGIVNANLLYFGLLAVFANAALAWLLLASGKDGRPRFDPGNVVVLMAFANLVVVFLFPPYEAVSVSGRFGGGSFDGFYFALGGTVRRTIFLPLLTIEVMYALLNACAFWLALRERAAVAVVDDSIGELIS